MCLADTQYKPYTYFLEHTTLLYWVVAKLSLTIFHHHNCSLQGLLENQGAGPCQTQWQAQAQLI